MKGRIPLKGGHEYDCFSWFGRRYLCYLGRAGVRKSIKRQYNRRVRRLSRLAIRGVW